MFRIGCGTGFISVLVTFSLPQPVIVFGLFLSSDPSNSAAKRSDADASELAAQFVVFIPNAKVFPYELECSIDFDTEEISRNK